MKSKYFITIVVIGSIGLVYILSHTKNIADLMKMPPLWHDKEAGNPHYYRSLLHETYPVFAYCYPLAVLLTVVKKPKIGLYIGCLFVIPLLILSFVFPWKGYRYLFFISPFFFIPVAVFIEHILYNSWVYFIRSTEKLLSGGSVKLRTFGVMLSGCASVIFIIYPLIFSWIKVKPSEFMDFGVYNFSRYADFVMTLNPDDMIICTEPFLLEHYASRKPDYMILTAWHTYSYPHYVPLRNQKGEEIDINGGIKLITDLSQLKAAEKTHKNIYIISNQWFLKPNPVDKDSIAYIKNTYALQPISNETFVVYYKQGEKT